MKKLSKSERKTILRRMELEQDVKQCINQTRSKHKDISWWGIGFRKLQIVIYPSFEMNLGWDIRNQNGDFVVYEYEINSERDLINPGYYLLDADSSKLQAIINDFYRLSVSIFMPEMEIGCDGTSYEVALFTGFQALRFCWWEEPHENWFQVNRMTRNAIEYFKTCKRIKNGIWSLD